MCWAATVARLAGPGGAALLAIGGLALGAVTFAAAWWAHRRSLTPAEDPA